MDRKKEEDKRAKEDPWKYGKSNGPVSLAARYVLRPEKCKDAMPAV